MHNMIQYVCVRVGIVLTTGQYDFVDFLVFAIHREYFFDDETKIVGELRVKYKLLLDDGSSV